MAYRKSKGKARRSKKIEPAVQTIWLAATTSADTTSTNYVDLSQVASLVNRRFYRQGINWAVAGIDTFSEITTEGVNPEGKIILSKLPSTWVMSNAWEKSFRTWQRMNNEALEENESIRPRFLDFKIYADSQHHIAGAANNLLPISSHGNFAAGEWKYSKVAIPDNTVAVGETTDREFIAVGASYPGVSPVTGLDAVSLIEGYAASRGLPQVTDPNVPGDADDVGPEIANPENWMSSVFTEGTEQTEDVLDRMVGENNLAPYPFEGATVGGALITDTQYPNGANQGPGLEVHEYGFITPTTVGNQTNFAGSTFPCGLMRFDITNSAVAPPGQSANMLTLIGIRLVPGHHRGYLCEPMTEM